MANPNFNPGTATGPMTASGVVKSGPGVIRGFYVSSTSSGTIKLYNNTAGSGTVLFDTITPAVGFHNLFDTAFNLGCYAVLGGTISVSFVWQ
jgi:hypothetical protein